MKFAKMLAAAAVAAMALMAFASTASATTLTVEGLLKNGPVTIHSTLRTGTSALLTDTFRVVANTCTTSTVHTETEAPFSTEGTTAIGGRIRALSWENCTEGNPTVHRMGELRVQARVEGHNGTVSSSGAEVTVPSPFGVITCRTSNTDIGELTAEVNIMDIRAVLECTGIGTARWTGTYTITSPLRLAVDP